MKQLPIGKVLGVIIGILATLLIWFYMETKVLKAELSITKNERQIAKANSEAYEKSLKELTKEVLQKEVDFKNNMNKHKKYVNEMEKTIRHAEVKSNECKDIKLILDDIRSNGY